MLYTLFASAADVNSLPDKKALHTIERISIDDSLIQNDFRSHIDHSHCKFALPTRGQVP